MCKVRIDEDYYLKEYFEGKGKNKKKKFRKSVLGTVYLSEIGARRAINQTGGKFLSYDLRIEEW